MKSPERRKFLKKSALAGSGAFLLPVILPGTSYWLPSDPIESMTVKEFVGKSHSDIAKVKALVEEYPHIINATWDWGDGDFETGIGAAGHVGNKDIVNFLIDKGARPDIFVLTMLGKTEIVKAILEAYPVLLNSLGPHGFTLLHHAQRGGDEAAELVEYFESKGMTETKVSIYKK